MRKISDTIARLAALQARNEARPASLGLADRLLELTGCGSNPGALSGKFHLPEDLPDQAPLVVVLHGCTQDAAGYDHHSGWTKLADEAGFALLYPEQQRSNNPNLCFNWFQPADTARNCGEALSIRQMIEAMVTTHSLDRKRIYITGLSAGGAMAAAMLASYPEVFAGGAIIAGLAYGTATTVPEAFDRMRGHGGPSDENLRRLLRDASEHRGPWPRISIWQGTGDQTVAASNAQAIASQWWGVHQIDLEPTHSHIDGRLDRQVWRDADGASVMEINMIAGMGHGTPIEAASLGTAGPYMLEAGISSTREIARFWGISEPVRTHPPHSRMATSLKTPTPVGSRANDVNKPKAKKPEPVLHRGGSRGATPRDPDVKTIIENALRSAGLMR